MLFLNVYLENRLLELLAQVFEDHIADEGRDQGDDEILEREDVVQAGEEALACWLARVNSPMSRLE